MKTANASANASLSDLLTLPDSPAHTLPSSRRDGECEQGEARARAEARASKSKSTQSRSVGSRKEAIPQSAKGKDSGRKPIPKSAAQYAPEPAVKPGESLDLLSQVESEDWLAERLKAHGCDIYAGGPYEIYADRLDACIVRNGMQAVIVGRAPDGKPENYAQAYERLYGKPLSKPRKAGAG